MKIGNTQYKKRHIILFIVIAAIALFLFAFLSWLVTDESITATSDAKFCVSCHSMEPFQQAHDADVHGGQNSHGVRATCAQCHLPHDSSFNYIVTKGRTGIHDLYVEYLGDPESIDWEAKRDNREEWVYDTGCLTCHTNLQQATMATNDAYIAHKAYFMGTTDDQCVTCHKNVGHHDLSGYISN
jgi:cytochrome c-type protein NapC